MTLGDAERDQIADVFRKHDDIQAIYLFGSYAADEGRRDSDLDLAVVPRNSQTREKKLALLEELADAGFCDVDLVFLDTDDIVLQYQAVRRNEVLYSAPDFDRGGTFSRVLRQYFDFEPYLEVQRRAYRRKLLG